MSSKNKFKWEVEYEGNLIQIGADALYINGKVHDENLGITTSAKLIGKLPDNRLVKVSIGGHWTLHCLIRVEDEIILDTRAKEN